MSQKRRHRSSTVTQRIAAAGRRALGSIFGPRNITENESKARVRRRRMSSTYKEMIEMKASRNRELWKKPEDTRWIPRFLKYRGNEMTGERGDLYAKPRRSALGNGFRVVNRLRCAVYMEVHPVGLLSKLMNNDYSSSSRSVNDDATTSFRGTSSTAADKRRNHGRCFCPPPAVEKPILLEPSQTIWWKPSPKTPPRRRRRSSSTTYRQPDSEPRDDWFVLFRCATTTCTGSESPMKVQHSKLAPVWRCLIIGATYELKRPPSVDHGAIHVLLTALPSSLLPSVEMTPLHTEGKFVVNEKNENLPPPPPPPGPAPKAPSPLNERKHSTDSDGIDAAYFPASPQARFYSPTPRRSSSSLSFPDNSNEVDEKHATLQSNRSIVTQDSSSSSSSSNEHMSFPSLPSGQSSSSSLPRFLSPSFGKKFHRNFGLGNTEEGLRGLSISFSASGWLFPFHLGVARGLQLHGASRNPTLRTTGTGVGAVIATLMLLNFDLEYVHACFMEAAIAEYGNFGDVSGASYEIDEENNNSGENGFFSSPNQDENGPEQRRGRRRNSSVSSSGSKNTFSCTREQQSGNNDNIRLRQILLDVLRSCFSETTWRQSPIREKRLTIRYATEPLEISSFLSTADLVMALLSTSSKDLPSVLRASDRWKKENNSLRRRRSVHNASNGHLKKERSPGSNIGIAAMKNRSSVTLSNPLGNARQSSSVSNLSESSFQPKGKILGTVDQSTITCCCFSDRFDLTNESAADIRPGQDDVYTGEVAMKRKRRRESNDVVNDALRGDKSFDRGSSKRNFDPREDDVLLADWGRKMPHPAILDHMYNLGIVYSKRWLEHHMPSWALFWRCKNYCWFSNTQPNYISLKMDLKSEFGEEQIRSTKLHIREILKCESASWAVLKVVRNLIEKTKEDFPSYNQVKKVVINRFGKKNWKIHKARCQEIMRVFHREREARNILKDGSDADRIAERSSRAYHNGMPEREDVSSLHRLRLNETIFFAGSVIAKAALRSSRRSKLDESSENLKGEWGKHLTKAGSNLSANTAISTGSSRRTYIPSVHQPGMSWLSTVLDRVPITQEYRQGAYGLKFFCPTGLKDFQGL
eukprot:g3355.t1